MSMFHSNSFLVFELPSTFENWGDAIDAVVTARVDGVEPKDVSADIWKIFETMAFVIVPKINR